MTRQTLTIAVTAKTNIGYKKCFENKKYIWQKRSNLIFSMKIQESIENEFLLLQKLFYISIDFKNFLFQSFSQCIFYLIYFNFDLFFFIITTEYKPISSYTKIINASYVRRPDLSKSLWKIFYIAKIRWFRDSFSKKAAKYKKSCINNILSFINRSFRTLSLRHNKKSVNSVKQSQRYC